ncbi:MAG: acyltransferase family protein [Thermoleophilia bacterium]|nr:acyltransferase family protein [Thermoleophilia bacterium]
MKVDLGPASELDIRTARRALALLNPRRLYHRAEIECADRLPAEGGAVIVSNHGRLDLDSFILAGLILRSRRRLVRILADHLWFDIPVVRRLWALAGAVDGTRENAARLLSREELVLTYPGGVREIMNGRFGHEHIEWSGRLGFARVAIEGGVPVIPVVSVGVNNGFVFLTSGRRLGRLLFQRLLRLGPAYSEYRDPLAIGLVPLPLPFSTAVHLPLPCKVRYVVGEPIWPAARASDSAGAAEFAAHVEEVMRALIAQYGRP